MNWDQNPGDWDVFVNETCIGCSACVAICGEVFDLDEDWLAFAKPWVQQSPEVDDAISCCPVNAISYK